MGRLLEAFPISIVKNRGCDFLEVRNELTRLFSLNLGDKQA